MGSNVVFHCMKKSVENAFFVFNRRIRSHAGLDRCYNFWMNCHFNATTSHYLILPCKRYHTIFLSFLLMKRLSCYASDSVLLVRWLKPPHTQSVSSLINANDIYSDLNSLVTRERCHISRAVNPFTVLLTEFHMNALLKVRMWSKIQNGEHYHIVLELRTAVWQEDNDIHCSLATALARAPGVAPRPCNTMLITAHTI